LRALQIWSYLTLDGLILAPAITNALKDNPEVLKITFDEAPSDLLAKLMQGSDERYRFSMSFQVRPVMVATAEPPVYSLLVGVDSTQSPPEIIGERGIVIPVTASTGPTIREVSPAHFEANDTVTIFGTDLDLPNLSVRLGTATLGVTAQRPDRLQFQVNGRIAAGTILSAGGYALSVSRLLTNSRPRSSNVLLGELCPTLTQAVAGPHVGNSRDVVLTGLLLGSASDEIFVAFYRNGRIVKSYDAPFQHDAHQTSLTLTVADTDPLPVGEYRVILRVNGEQARNSPKVTVL